MSLKVGLAAAFGVLAIPFAVAIKLVNTDMTVGKGAADALAGKTTQVEPASDKKADIKDLPRLGKFKLDKYEEPKQP